MVAVEEIIAKKERGCELSESEIDLIVQGYTQGKIPDKEMTPFLAAVYNKGMSFSETVALTRSMINSGETVDLRDVPGSKVDKHSTGGVGDKTTLVVAPLVASCGAKVAKMSGRSLGHTGGTLDKLESIRGFKVNLSKEKFIDQVRRIGIAIVSQTADLVPADKKIYILRDKTGTVSSLPLIASSVMSKKIAAGADAIVLDVKTGSGAFMKTFEKARELAEMCVSIGNLMGKRIVALITNMNQPLGRAVGNALEVREAIETLKGEGPSDLSELSFAIASEMIILSGQALKKEDARELLLDELDSGNALDKMAELIKAQGGDPKVVENPTLLPKAKMIEELSAKKDGYITEIDAEKVGWIAKKLFGLVFHRKIGDGVTRGELIAEIHANRLDDIKEAQTALYGAIDISDRALTEPLIYSIIRP